jgi:hypothetical protein
MSLLWVEGEHDKIRFSDTNPGFVIRHIECSDKRSYEFFITFWIVAGEEDALLPQVKPQLWKNAEDCYKHNEAVYHREGHGWTDLRHHYHIPTDCHPNRDRMGWFFDIIDSAGARFISPELKHCVLSYYESEEGHAQKSI